MAQTPILTKILREEAEKIATPEIRDRIWEGLICRLRSYELTKEKVKSQREDNIKKP